MVRMGKTQNRSLSPLPATTSSEWTQPLWLNKNQNFNVNMNSLLFKKELTFSAVLERSSIASVVNKLEIEAEQFLKKSAKVLVEKMGNFDLVSNEVSEFLKKLDELYPIGKAGSDPRGATRLLNDLLNSWPVTAVKLRQDSKEILQNLVTLRVIHIRCMLLAT